MQQGWKQMLRNAKTPARHGRVGAETEGTPSRTVTHSHQLIDFIKKEKKKSLKFLRSNIIMCKRLQTGGRDQLTMTEASNWFSFFP